MTYWQSVIVFTLFIFALLDKELGDPTETGAFFITGVAATGNTVAQNKIGTNAAGTAEIPNVTDGVAIFAPGNIVNWPSESSS